MKVKKLKDDIYKNLMWLVWDCEYEDYNQWLAKKFDVVPTINSACSAEVSSMMSDNGDVAFVMWVSNLKKDSACYSDIHHEVNHLTFFALQACGVKIDADNTEVFCYYGDYLFKQILDAI